MKSLLRSQLRMIIIILLIATPVFNLYAVSTGTAQIAMVTWRGKTDAEQGFMDAIKPSAIKTAITEYAANQDLSRLQSIVEQLIFEKPDLIYVFGTTATKTVLKRITKIPVIFNIVNRPVEAGIIKSWEHSGNNATGASNQVPVINQLKTLKKIIDFKRLGIIYNPNEQNSAIQRNIAYSLEQKMGFTLIDYQIRRQEDISRIMPQLKDRVEAVYIPADSKINSLGKKISSYITDYKIPSLSASEMMVTDHGILLGLIPDYYQLGQLAARKALRVLKGEAPGDVPSSTLKYFNVSVNMVTAKSIDTQIPMSLLIIANHIIR